MTKYKPFLKTCYSNSALHCTISALMLISALCFSSSLLFGQTTKGLGKYGASFLQISSSARQVGMGEAFTGLADDINFLRYNIGGLGSVRSTMMSIDLHNWIQDTQQGAIGLALPSQFGIFGVDFRYFNEGTITELNPDFTPTGSEISSNDIALSLGYGSFINLFGRNVSFGGALKIVRQNLAEQTATALGMDLGVLIRTKYLSYGATIQNLGITKLKFIEREDALPEIYRGGIGVHFPIGRNLKVNMDLDLAWMQDQEIRTYYGAEVLISKRLAVRGGYKFHDFEPNRWGTGMGLIIPMTWLANSHTRLDYSFSPLDAFAGSAHRISLVFSFGATTDIRAAGLSAEDAQRISELTDKLQQEVEAAERARLSAEESEKRMQEMEKLMADRLERIQSIAKESKGKIEVLTETPSDDSILVTMRINFDFDKANIRPDEFETMRRVGEILNTYPGTKVHISGHTDFIGTEEYNIRLSHRRVDSVMTFLTQKENVDLDRFFMPVGYGKQRPIASNQTREGRFKNRRVDFVIYTTDNAPPVPEGSAIKDVELADSQTVKIICNGKVGFTDTFLSNPDRIVLDFPGIFLLPTETTIKFTNDIFIRARLGYHQDEKFTRVVLDLRRPIEYRVLPKDNIIYVRALNTNQ